MAEFTIPIGGIIVLICYIVAIASRNWAETENKLGIVEVGLFKTSGAIRDSDTAVEVDTCDYISSQGLGDSTCDKVHVAAGLTIVALFILLCGTLVAFARRFRLAGFIFFLSGLCGMVGWLIFYVGVQRDLENGYLSGYDIGYSQGLSIAAWALTFFLVLLTCALQQTIAVTSSEGVWLLRAQ